MYSAPKIAMSQLLVFLFMVEKNTEPPGFTILAQALTTELGSGTCSSISKHVTTSKDSGLDFANSSDETH